MAETEQNQDVKFDADADIPARTDGFADQASHLKALSEATEPSMVATETASPHHGESWNDAEAKAGSPSTPSPSSTPALRKVPAFKSVSVSKAFLAQSSAGPSAAPTVTRTMSEAKSASGSPQPSPSMSSISSRPRLVAKMGRDSKMSSNNSESKVSAEPQSVWNRNRVNVPQSQQSSSVSRNYTDEELAQYGIHMAARIPADGNQKSSTWADLDEDDDSWVPEQLEWKDGTKSTTRQPPKPEQNATTVASAPQSQELAGLPSQTQETPSAILPRPSQSIEQQEQPLALRSTGKTILRPGQRSQPAKPGVQLQSMPDSSPERENIPKTTSKSPWAPIPQTDKHSPVRFSPPQTHSSVNQPQRSVEHPPAEPSSVNSTQQMAADDFKRFSGQEAHQNQRELFNSRSGRYEPVPGNRRSSVNSRPSQDARTHGPDSPNQRRPSGTGLQTNQLSSPRTETKSSEVAVSSEEQKQEPEVSLEDARANQMRLMRERVEANRLRKKEEEEREEAERKERIKQKMLSLGLLPDKQAPKANDLVEATEREESKAVDSKPGEKKSHSRQDSSTKNRELKWNRRRSISKEEVKGSQPSENEPPKDLKSPQQPRLDSATVTAKAPQESTTKTFSPPLSSISEPANEPQQLFPSFQGRSMAHGSSSLGSLPWGAKEGNPWNSSPGKSVWGPPSRDRVLGNGSFGNPHMSTAPGSGRGSRFFGSGVDRGMAPQTHSSQLAKKTSESASPPPPDSIDHPAFGNNESRPLVHLPPPLVPPNTAQSPHLPAHSSSSSGFNPSGSPVSSHMRHQHSRHVPKISPVANSTSPFAIRPPGVNPDRTVQSTSLSWQGKFNSVFQTRPADNALVGSHSHYDLAPQVGSSLDGAAPISYQTVEPESSTTKQEPKHSGLTTIKFPPASSFTHSPQDNEDSIESKYRSPLARQLGNMENATKHTMSTPIYIPHFKPATAVRITIWARYPPTILRDGLEFSKSLQKTSQKGSQKGVGSLRGGSVRSRGGRNGFKRGP